MKINARLFVNNADGEWLALFTGQINLFSPRDKIVLTNNNGEYILPVHNVQLEKSGTTILIIRNDEQYALSFDTERNRNLYYEFFNENVEFENLEELGAVLTARLSEFSVLYVVNRVIDGSYIDRLIANFDAAIFVDLVGLRRDEIMVEIMEREKELLGILRVVDGDENGADGAFVLYESDGLRRGNKKENGADGAFPLDESDCFKCGSKNLKEEGNAVNMNDVEVTEACSVRKRTVCRDDSTALQYSLNATSDKHVLSSDSCPSSELLRRVLPFLKDDHTKEYLRKNEPKLKKLLLINKINREELPDMPKEAVIPLLPYIKADIHTQKMFLRQYVNIVIEMFINDERTMAQILREHEFFVPFKEYAQDVLTYEKDNVRVTMLEILKRMMCVDDHAFLNDLFLCLHDVLLIGGFYTNEPPRIDEMMHSVLISIADMHGYHALEFFLSTNLLKRMIGTLLTSDLPGRVCVMRVILNLIRSFGQIIVDYVVEHRAVLLKMYESVRDDKNMVYSLMCALFIAAKPHFDSVFKDAC